MGQEALRLELYRKIATARDNEEQARVRTEAEDRYGALPPSVRVLFAVASLKIACLAKDVEEIATVRNQIRIKPVPEARGYEIAAALREAIYHATTQTLNLVPPQQFAGELLVSYVEDALA